VQELEAAKPLTPRPLSPQRGEGETDKVLGARDGLTCDLTVGGPVSRRPNCATWRGGLKSQRSPTDDFIIEVEVLSSTAGRSHGAAPRGLARRDYLDKRKTSSAVTAKQLTRLAGRPMRLQPHEYGGVSTASGRGGVSLANSAKFALALARDAAN